jgi:biotin carboxylase
VKPHLLVVGTGDRMFREYLLRSIARDYRVHLFLTAEPTWETEYAAAWTVLPSTTDAEVLVAAAADLHRRDALDGVLCWDEARILPTAEVAAALELPGSSVAAVERCRDKHLTRQALAAAQVPQPESVLVADVDSALAVADRIGYPVVLKPRALAASLGVVLVPDAAALRAGFDFAHDTTVPEAPAYDVSVLVEEYAEGPEVSVDCAVSGGRVLPLFLAHKRLGYAPYFEEVGHEVRARDALLRIPSVVRLLEDAHEALGLTDGMTHTELRLTPRGPRLIEVNARIGGDLIPYLGMRATGIDPGLAAAAIACGRAPSVTPSRAECGAVEFHYVPYEMPVAAVAFDTLPRGIDQAVVLAAPGRVYAPPPAGTVWGRVAYATAVAPSIDECRQALAAARPRIVADGAAA